MTITMLLGVGFALGIVLLVRGLVPPRTDLAFAVGRWEVARRHASRPGAGGSGLQGRIGRWVADEFAKRGVEFGQLRPDLAITGRSLEEHFAAMTVTTAAALLVPAALGVFAEVAGISIGFMIPLVAGVIFALIAVVGSHRQLHVDAEAKRGELRRALGTYLDLVHMSLADIGTGWAFELIGDTISRARRTGETPWRALGDLGATLGLQELVDLAASLTLVGDNGAKVRASLAARAGTLRRRQLADAHADADAADDSMRITQIVLAAGFMILLGYPAVMNVLAS
jgi:tight adherence protein C